MNSVLFYITLNVAENKIQGKSTRCGKAKKKLLQRGGELKLCQLLVCMTHD